MTDDEIIKAYECCNKMDNGKGCFECPYRQYCPDCLRRRNEDTIDLINRQKEEIERLNAYNENLQTGNIALSNEILDIRAEAVKEFVSKVNEVITEIYNKHIFGSNDLEAEEKDAIINFSDDVTSEVNNILKEMAGVEDA